MTTASPIRPGRLRRRLAIAFVLVGGVSAGALATGAYLLVRHERLQDSVNRALVQSRTNLVVAQSYKQNAALAAAFSREGGFYSVIASAGHVPPGLLPVPVDLRQIVQRRGQMGYERLTVRGDPLLAVGVPDQLNRRQLYFYFDERQLWNDLDQLRNVLVGAWIVVLAASAIAGMVLARRMLAPVGAASDAARSLAEGLLDTRLPAGGRDEFGAWADSFNTMADALQAKITELTEAQARERRFTADVAHELRTPLTALVNEAALLARHADVMPDEARRMSELLTRDLGRLRRLVDELLEISRLDAGQEQIEVGEVDVGALVDSLCSARGWDGAVAVRGGRGTCVTTDPRRLERILANLVDNALAHGGGRADISITEQAGGVAVRVADHGPGVPAEFRDRLFERFSKADTARAGAGSGLGLAIAAENAALIGARIEVDSVPDAGTRFTLHLPDTPGGPS